MLMQVAIIVWASCLQWLTDYNNFRRYYLILGKEWGGAKLKPIISVQISIRFTRGKYRHRSVGSTTTQERGSGVAGSQNGWEEFEMSPLRGEANGHPTSESPEGHAGAGSGT